MQMPNVGYIRFDRDPAASCSHIVGADRIMISQLECRSVPWKSMTCVAGIAQVVALLYYTISYFPGGTNGVFFVMKMAFGAFTNCLRGMQRAVTG
jgi:hypothetical protein